VEHLPLNFKQGLIKEEGKMPTIKQNESCEVHGTSSRSANRILFLMILASLSLIIWHVWVYGPTTRRADHELLQRPFLVLLGSEIWDLLFDRQGVVAELWSVFPYFIFGILLAGFIRTYKLAARLRNTLDRYGLLSIFLASLVGILTPLCACGILTTAISLLFAGMPLAPVMALLVTSPVLSPSAYPLTLNDLGPDWVVIRTIAAFSIGVFAGIVTHLLRNKGFQTDNIFIEGAIPEGDFHDSAYPDRRLRCNCKESFGNRVATKSKNMFLVFLAKSSDIIWLVGKYVLIGVSIGTILERYIPYEWIYNLFGKEDNLNIIWVTLGSVPIFLHHISVSSILYHIKSALNGTLNGGAGLALMIGGSVTAIPTMVMFWTIFKKRVFFLYMFVCIVGTIIIAYAFQLLVFVPGVDTGNPLLKGVRSLSGGVSSIINKQSKQVRIVMAPEGKGMIATYSNDIEGEGGIVFDSGLERFTNDSADKFNNLTYINNIAEWLEENSNHSPEKGILIYRFGGNKNIFSKDAAAALEKKGFKIRITDRYENPEVSERLLGGYSQFWLFFVESDSEVYFSEAELGAISGFIRSGNGMLIAGKGTDDLSSANQLSSRYGVIFSGFVENKEELPVSIAPYFFDEMAGILGNILKFLHKA
jgi:uncharacterized membrane protein YraQ (UPF0718 family)